MTKYWNNNLAVWCLIYFILFFFSSKFNAGNLVLLFYYLYYFLGGGGGGIQSTMLTCFDFFFKVLLAIGRGYGFMDRESYSAPHLYLA